MDTVFDMNRSLNFVFLRPIKVPAVCHYAHKLAELGGAFDDAGDSINAEAFANTAFFL
jgi:hypothetical protein